jgi:hypothetical protein
MQNIDEEEYAAFLWLLLETIVDPVAMPPNFKRDSQIGTVPVLKYSTRNYVPYLPVAAAGDHRGPRCHAAQREARLSNWYSTRTYIQTVRAIPYRTFLWLLLE